MKLISLYIENFGGLSRYELQFGPGLTTINEPNGFGKTTLAEFIRAMLYGFPRKVKTLEKSRRQKYAPWNGGQYGGYLTFEHENRRFRLERTFGATPKGDTFTLIDLSTNRKSNRFSEEIGIEIFGLDSDSFERSTYVPQTHEEGTLSTAAIQAKLTDLVEDSSDVNNYDKAMAQLRAKRSALIPYRGSGGAVAEASGKITQLQLQLDQALLQQSQLTTAQEEAARTELEIEQKQTAMIQLREELSAASEMAAAAAQQRQYAELRERCQQAKEQARAYGEKFRNGKPDLQLLRQKCQAYEKWQKNIRDLEQQAAQLLQEDRQGRATETVGSYTGMLLLGILCAVLGTAGLACGIAFLTFGKIPMGVAALCGGIGLLAIGIVLLIVRGKKRSAQAQVLELQRRTLDSRITAAEQELQTLRSRAKASADEIGVFFASYDLNVPPQHFFAGLTQLEHNILAWEQAQRVVQELTGQLTAMEQEWGEVLYAQRSSFADPRLLREQERCLRDEVMKLDSQLQRELQKIHRLREQTELIPQLREELAGWQQKKTEDRENARILDDTMDFLQQAKERLSGSYLRTIESRFGYYLAQLESSDGERYLIDTDLQVQLERMGRARELAYFSAGQVDLVMLCMRLALVDALFKGQETFVILDDPFVNLDDAHTEQALELLRSLSDQKQILYLTCHSSRAL